jgi:hypothetical protein
MKTCLSRELVFDLIFWGAGHGISQHFKNVVQLRAKLPGRPILRPARGQSIC